MFVDERSNNLIMISSEDLMSHMMVIMMEDAGLIRVPQTSVQM